MIKTLEELKEENLPKATGGSVDIKVDGKDREVAVKIFDKYFSDFVDPKSTGSTGDGWITGSQNCVQCGRRLDGLLGTFGWGLAHGEGNCGECGYPSRAHHKIKDEDGEPFAEMRNQLLQYHPDGLERRETE